MCLPPNPLVWQVKSLSMDEWVNSPGPISIFRSDFEPDGLGADRFGSDYDRDFGGAVG